MTFQLKFHPLAEQDYVDAYQWYENEQKGLGQRFEKMVDHRLQMISQNPENYHLCKAPYREVAVEFFPYTIVYKMNKRKKTVFITAIYHTKRSPRYKYRK